MSTIIHTKIRGTTYCYYSESYWDKKSKSPKSKRVLIGKIDPETGEMVPTRPRGRKKREEQMTQQEEEQYKAKESRISAAMQNDVYRKQCDELKQRLLEAEKELMKARDEREAAVKKLNRLIEAIKMLPYLHPDA